MKSELEKKNQASLSELDKKFNKNITDDADEL